MGEDIQARRAGRALAHQGDEMINRRNITEYVPLRPMSRQYSSNTNSSTSSSFILDYGNSFSEKGSFDVR